MSTSFAVNGSPYSRYEELAHQLEFRLSPCRSKIIKPDGTHQRLYQGNRYLMFGFGPKTDRKRCHLHRFIGYCKYGDAIYQQSMCVRHKDDNPLNNAWDNILIGTCHDNMMDQAPELRLRKAWKASSKRMKYNHVEVVQFYLAHGFSAALRHFGMTKSNMSHIINKSASLKIGAGLQELK